MAAILRLADGQRGLVSRAQLLRCGLTRDGIHRLVKTGWLRPALRGVYVAGSAPPAKWLPETAAVLACSPNARLSGVSALDVWGIRSAPPGAAVHITMIGRRVRSREGVEVHHAASLHPLDLRSRERLPVTGPARALLDSATLIGMHETERAVDEALALGLADRPGLLAVLDRYPGHRGARILRELADPSRASEITKSQAEKALARLLRRAGAPPSATQYPIGPYKADRCWPELRLIIEVDGVQFHRDRKRMEDDNARADYLRHRGWVVVRFTRRQVVYEPEYVMLCIGRELALAERAHLTA